jgi:non-heme chloroperoxidase
MVPQRFQLPDGADLAYTDTGEGRPLLLLHGVCMSRLFFERNIDALARGHRVVAVDFRSHGDSTPGEGGHTVAQYARDVRALLEHLDLTDVVVVGWSMGALVTWEYLAQFGADRVTGVVVVSQGPSDLIQTDWPHGIADPAGLGGFIEAMQGDFRGFFAGFVPLMFADGLADEPERVERFVDEICRVGVNAGTAIFADQTLRDYRSVIPSFTVPHLLVWGADEKVIASASGTWLADALPDGELVTFAASGHCPMWEEPDRFNALVEEWVLRRSAGESTGTPGPG